MSLLSTTRRPGSLRPARAGVPWTTVLTLAVVLSCTGAFWLVSLTGAIGVTQRGEQPFATWVMLSLTLVSVYALVVLGALVLARRWFGPTLHGTGQVLATGLLLVAAGTVLGVASIVASSWFDYSVQVHHITGMPGMGSCTGSCVPREQHDIFVLHVRGVLLVSQKLLLTNAVLVAWLVAMWGGRIKLVRRSRTDDTTAERDGVPAGSLRTDVRLLLAGTLLGAAAIHAAIVPEHLEEWSSAGRFFILLTVADLVIAGLLLTGNTGRRLLLVTALVSVMPLTAWLWSRTVGLPFGPEPGVAEAIGVPDVLACVLELIALVAAVALLDRGRLQGPAPSPHSRGLVVLALIAVTTFGFAATGPAWFDAFGVAASHSAMEMSP